MLESSKNPLPPRDKNRTRIGCRSFADKNQNLSITTEPSKLRRICRKTRFPANEVKHILAEPDLLNSSHLDKSLQTIYTVFSGDGF